MPCPKRDFRWAHWLRLQQIWPTHLGSRGATGAPSAVRGPGPKPRAALHEAGPHSSVGPEPSSRAHSARGCVPRSCRPLLKAQAWPPPLDCMPAAHKDHSMQSALRNPHPRRPPRRRCPTQPAPRPRRRHARGSDQAPACMQGKPVHRVGRPPTMARMGTGQATRGQLLSCAATKVCPGSHPPILQAHA